jgi:rhodanese-related sulfurtransferase
MGRIKLISIDELLEMRANNDKFKLVEVLSKDSYKSGHIPGAINIPTEALGKEAPKLLKKDEVIVVYCASYHCEASTYAAKILMDLGYKKVLDFKGSKKLWVDSGLELEK